jgi:hypothetical protein
MPSGKVSLISCPLCGQQGRKVSCAGWNTSKPQLWSDGKKLSPDANQHPWLVKCRKCSNFFYADEPDATYITSQEDIDQVCSDVPYLKLPSFEEYFEGLGSEIFEKYLRLEALHCYNDLIRNNRENEITPDMHDLYIDNLKTMLYFLSEDDPDELFIVIEINRQLGRFEKCMMLMKKADDKKHKFLRSIYMTEIVDRNPRLFRIY